MTKQRSLRRSEKAAKNMSAKKISGQNGDISESEAGGARRLDRWLQISRFFRSRSMATRLCRDGKVRVNRKIMRKPGYVLEAGDVLTFPQGRQIRVVRVMAFAERRGPASEAALLYQEIHVDAEDIVIMPDGSGRVC